MGFPHLLILIYPPWGRGRLRIVAVESTKFPRAVPRGVPPRPRGTGQGGGCPTPSARAKPGGSARTAGSGGGCAPATLRPCCSSRCCRCCLVNIDCLIYIYIYMSIYIDIYIYIYIYINIPPTLTNTNIRKPMKNSASNELVDIKFISQPTLPQRRILSFL